MYKCFFGAKREKDENMTNDDFFVLRLFVTTKRKTKRKDTTAYGENLTYLRCCVIAFTRVFCNVFAFSPRHSKNFSFLRSENVPKSVTMEMLIF